MPYNHAKARVIRFFCGLLLTGIILGGCATGDPYSFRATGVYGVTWVPVAGQPGSPPYSASARESGVQGRVVFAVLLDSAGAVDHRTLSVMSVSDLRVLAIACPWIERTKFRVGEATAPYREGSRLSLIGIEYSPSDTIGRLIVPETKLWAALTKVDWVSTMIHVRQGIPQCQ